MLEVFDRAEAHEFHRRAPHMFEMQAIVRSLLGRIRLEVVSDDVRQFDLDSSPIPRPRQPGLTACR